MKIILLLVLSIFSTVLFAAEVSIEACASVTVTESSSPDVINGFAEKCINLTRTLETGEPGTYKAQSEGQTLELPFGGCNSTGADVTHTIEHRWRYSITTNAEAEERATAYVTHSSSPLRYTEGADTFVETFSDLVIENGVCADGIVSLSAGFDLATGLDSNTLRNDQDAAGLFYDPDNPGHGFDFNVHQQGFTMYYYGHTADGERLWLVSETLDTNLEYGNSYELEMYEVADGVFGQPVLPETSWGTITITLDDCDNGYASIDGIDGKFDMNLVRIVRENNSGCS